MKTEQPSNTNRLIHEKSPYLLQHAHNPVDWYPWGPEALERAKKEQKPIFLSIGYSTCHWCHVMEEESFENPDIAKIMNDGYVSIKVDREERPDLDNIYMQAVMATTGSGGWPMSVFLTPEGKPFYGGTYFPPEDRWGRPGFGTVLMTIREKWNTEREKLLKAGDEIAKLLQTRVHAGESKTALTEAVFDRAYDEFSGQFDPEGGGIGGAPKFPRSHSLSFLLHYWKRTNEKGALAIVEKTLQAMAAGGMYDQLGGGFHRYSTDDKWRIPHFEKMLYDQAILARSYLEAFQATQNAHYAGIARGIFEYVLRDLTDTKGAFYSAEDADSAADPAQPRKKSEGAFYLWQESEIIKLLGKENAGIIQHFYGIRAEGNAIQDPHGEFENKNVLYEASTLEETAEKFGKKPAEIKKIIEDSKKVLSAARAKRPRPHLDDKVLTDWNSLMISSLAFGARILNEPSYAERAQKAADFLIQNMKSKDGRLLHRFRDGEAAVPGFLDDYAFFIRALLDVYEATFEINYLEEARFLTGEMMNLFWDGTFGGFFFSGTDHEKLISRSKELYDGAVPSGNSAAALVLLRLARMTMDRNLEKHAKETFDAFAVQISQFPSGYPQMLIALDFAFGPSSEIVIAAEKNGPHASAFLKSIYAQFHPNKIVLLRPPKGEEAQKIEALCPFVVKQVPVGGKPSVYVCKNYICELPVTEMTQLETLLKS